MIVARTGNEAMAEAMRQVNPDVVAAYPITPATEIVQIFSSFVHDGLVDTKFVAVESEHSAMSACIGAAAAGARVMTGTASQGLALMHEMLFIAAALRLPIVLCVVNRSLSAPINIHCDHSDTLASRDSGWIQIYTENSQEAYDSVIQAVKISERALLPVMVTIDGFIISHGMERIDILDDREVREYLGEPPKRPNLLDIDKPITMGPLDLQDYFFEHKRSEIEGMNTSLPHIEAVAREYKERFGRYYPVIDTYRIDDAEVAVMAMGSAAGTAKVVVDRMREKGKKVGLIRMRVVRPFPKNYLKELIQGFAAVGIMDRSDTLSTLGGHLYVETRAVLYRASHQPPIKNYIYGLGGRDISLEEIEEIFEEVLEIGKSGKVTEPVVYKGVRE
ncbi:pyruvate ferredoxin oxidoreductase [candidate division WOR-3 bacterium]|uniref:Pyruvate ferredoxin oxidoreductase n=1 Tax=candidate division WOR-3 bacterium TaxID=2052148 RepID=A0A660SIP8_UNCW3|nr:MAG: pyruvate ferredoxin oxidoreductase [candidate division WOR-3 bacterium]